MYRIDNARANASLPTPAAVGPKPNGYFTTDTIVTSDWANAVQEELCYVIEQAGITLDKTDRTQLYTAIQFLISTGPSGITAVEQDLNPKLGGNLDVNSFSFVSVSNGNITFAPNGTGAIDLNGATILVHTDLQHRGDTDNKITFGADTQDFRTGGSSRMDISNSGLRLGGANARVTTILDEDDMASDSATALATQQSIKAYVDNETAGLSGSLSSYYDLFSDTSMTAGQTWYFSFAGATQTTPPGSDDAYKAYCWIAPSSGTVEYFDVRTLTAPGAGQTYTFTLMKNGSTTSMTSSSTGTGAFAVSDYLNPVSVAEGDAIQIKVVLSAGATTLTRIAGKIQFTPS